MLAAARNPKIPNSALIPSAAGALLSARLISALRALVLYFRLWPQQPGVLSAGALH